MSEAQDRRGYLGGTDISAIFGVNPWKSTYDLWEEKTAAEFVQPEIEPAREKRFRRGKKFEPWVIELLEEEHGIFVQKRNQRYTDEEYPWMSCEIDFEYMGDLGLCNGDIKTISPFAAGEWGEEGTDELPLYYCLQFMWGLMITKRPMCLVGAMIGADDLRVYQVKRDEELIASMRSKALQFWKEHVEKRIAPTPVTVSDVQKVLFRYGGLQVAWDEGIGESLRQLREVKEAAKEIKKLEEKYALEVKKALIVKAEAMGITDAPKKFIINDITGKRTASFGLVQRSGYTVGPSEFWELRV